LYSHGFVVHGSTLAFINRSLQTLSIWNAETEVHVAELTLPDGIEVAGEAYIYETNVNSCMIACLWKGNIVVWTFDSQFPESILLRSNKPLVIEDFQTGPDREFLGHSMEMNEDFIVTMIRAKMARNFIIPAT
jgi:hypothetical protein